MSSVLERTSARLLASSPNYLEVTVVITVVAASRFLFKPFFCSFSPRLCVSIASVAVVFLYACLGKGQIFTYLGWVARRRPVYWLYAILAGVAGAVGALFILRGTGLSVGSAPATELLYGVTLGPVIEEVIFRGAAFSVVYVTACSAKILMHWRIGISGLVTSLLLCLEPYPDHRHSLDGDLSYGYCLCVAALAFQFNRHFGSYARHL
jgi:hypothetical protein